MYARDMESRVIHLSVTNPIKSGLLTQAIISGDEVEDVSIRTLEENEEGKTYSFLRYKDKNGDEIDIAVETVERIIYDYSRLVLAPASEKELQDTLAKVRAQFPKGPDKNTFLAEMRTEHEG